MVLYYPLTVARTDGCQEYTVNGIIFANCPKDVTTGQDAKGRVYNKLDKDSPKHTRWRAMLGNLLMQQINRGVDDGTYAHDMRSITAHATQVSSISWRTYLRDMLSGNTPEKLEMPTRDPTHICTDIREEGQNGSEAARTSCRTFTGSLMV
jgi:hypothetical protein